MNPRVILEGFFKNRGIYYPIGYMTPVEAKEAWEVGPPGEEVPEGWTDVRSAHFEETSDGEVVYTSSGGEGRTRVVITPREAQVFSRGGILHALSLAEEIRRAAGGRSYLKEGSKGLLLWPPPQTEGPEGILVALLWW